MSGRLVPWASWRDWEVVREELFSVEVPAVLSGLDKVQAWRRRGKVPLGVDITALLLSTSLKDPHGPGPCPYKTLAAIPESSLQIEYSLAMIRLVNGVSDASQKGKVAGSVSKHADSAGLHPMLVDIRHEATHNHIPSLHMLRLAASHSLTWLYNNYWAAQRDRADASSSEALSVVKRLLANQAARASVLAPTTTSSQLSDNGSTDEGSPDPDLSPAALKKQQKALLGELRPLIPSSHPADLASLLLSSSGAPILLQSRALPPDIIKFQTSQSPTVHPPSHNTLMTTVTLLNTSWPGFLSHLIVQAVDILQSAKALLIHGVSVPNPASTAADPEQGDAPSAAAPDLHVAACWAASAMEVSEGSSDAPPHRQRLRYALRSLFKPSMLFPADDAPPSPPTTGRHDIHPEAARHCAAPDRLQMFYTQLFLPEACYGGAGRPGYTQRGGRGIAGGAQLRGRGNSSIATAEDAHGGSAANRAGVSIAVAALLRFELALLQMCKASGDAEIKGMARLATALLTSLAPRSEDSVESQPMQASADSRRRGQAVLQAPALKSRAVEPAAVAAPAGTTCSVTIAHDETLARMHSSHSAASHSATSLGTAAYCAGDAAGSKRGRWALGARSTHDVATPPARKQRFTAAHAWSSCPVGTVPTGVAGVGAVPQFLLGTGTVGEDHACVEGVVADAEARGTAEGVPSTDGGEGAWAQGATVCEMTAALPGPQGGGLEGGHPHVARAADATAPGGVGKGVGGIEVGLAGGGGPVEVAEAAAQRDVFAALKGEGEDGALAETGSEGQHGEEVSTGNEEPCMGDDMGAYPRRSGGMASGGQHRTGAESALGEGLVGLQSMVRGAIARGAEHLELRKQILRLCPTAST